MSLLLLLAAWAGVCVTCTFLFAACLSIGQSRGGRRCASLELAPDVVPVHLRHALSVAAAAVPDSRVTAKV